MPVIVASPAYPRPPIDGDKVRWSALLSELARLEPLHTVFGFMGSLGEIRDPTYERLFASVDVVPTPRLEVTLRATTLAARGRPSAFGRRATPRWRRAVVSAAAADPRTPLLLLGTSGGYIPPVGNRSLLDLLDVRSRLRTASGDRLISKAVLDAELALGRRHHLILASEADRRWLIDHGAAADRLAVIANGVDPGLLELTPAPESATILFVGSLRYPPNLEGIRWFLESCWPQVHARRPDARLQIVGYDAGRIQPTAGVEVHADVPDVRPHYSAAALSIAPLLTARGVQNKVLEAMAAGLPVVATTPVARGLFDHHPALVAEDAAVFTATCLRLLGDRDEARLIGAEGRAYVRQHHDWAASAIQLRDLLHAG